MTTQSLTDPIPEPTREQGVRALLTDLIPGEKPLSPEELKACRDYCLRNALEKDGVHVISYTFDAEYPANYEYFERWVYRIECYETEPLNNQQRSQVRTQMDRIEKIANLQFVEIDPDRTDEADISFFKSNVIRENGGGFFVSHTSPHDIILDRKIGFSPLPILHETLHVLGLSHPNANHKSGESGGYTPEYNQDITVMSYNPDVHSFSPQGLGYLDVAALQLIYGEPKKPIYPDGIKSNELREERYLYDNRPLTLDFRGTLEGSIDIDSKKINGYFDSDRKWINAYIVRDTQIKDVLADNSTTTLLNLTGNDLPNRLQGGMSDDSIRPRGGNDVLTGNGGKNTFYIDDKSGLNNVITDHTKTYDDVPMSKFPEDQKTKDITKEFLNPLKEFFEILKPSKNQLMFDRIIRKVELSDCTGVYVQGEEYKGTQVLCKDYQDKNIASVIVPDATPQQLEVDIHSSNMQFQRILPHHSAMIYIYVGPSISIVPATPDTNSQHPSGLPNNLQPAGGKQRGK